MALQAGSQLGSYEIVAPLGSGGMGDVYRARDTRLGRDVALKILPPFFAGDAERIARFRREAQILAALNHPHIATIYELADAGPGQFLTMELVEGGTLSDRLAAARGAGLPVPDAFALARQIADALQAAHDKGIVHRDLKPANIGLTEDGQVKVLDFGLAKAGEGGPSASLSNSPTLTCAPDSGGLLGTAGYMSPEQATGAPADKRSDVWAFGCVLFEMLTGRRAFDGTSAVEIVAAILRGEPDWNRLPAALPPHIRLLVRKCLEKSRANRISDMAVARFLLDDRMQVEAAPAAPQARASRRAMRLGLSIAAAAGALVVGVAFAVRPAADPPHPRVRFALVSPELQRIPYLGGDRDIDVSADGTTIVFRGTGDIGSQPQLFARRLDELDAHPLPGTVDARSPAISPDGRWIAFINGSALNKIPIGGGSPTTIARVPPTARGTSWGPDGTIVFSAADRNGALMAAPDTGGDARTLVAPDPAHPDPAGRAYDFPSVLPGGQGVLFTIGAAGGSPDVVDLASIAVLDLRTGQRKVLVRGGSQPRYVGGYLVFGTAGVLRAVRFDLARLAIVGEPVPIVDKVLTTSTGAFDFAVSETGTLVYLPAGAESLRAARRLLVWVDRQGREEPIPLPARAFADPRLSPDGMRIAVGIRDERNDIWIAELRRHTLTRLTSRTRQRIRRPSGRQCA